MSFTFSALPAGLLAILLGFAIGFFTRKILAGRRAAQAEARAEEILNKAKLESQDTLLDAKNKSLKLLEDAKREEKERRVQLDRIENLLTKREEDLEVKTKDLDKEHKIIADKNANLDSLKVELDDERRKQIRS